MRRSHSCNLCFKRLWHKQIATPQACTSHWVQHLHREHNSEADSAADIASETRKPYSKIVTRIPARYRAVRLFFDGTIGTKSDNALLIPASGVVVQILSDAVCWKQVAIYSFSSSPTTTTMGAELDGFIHAVAIAEHLLTHNKLPQACDSAYVSSVPASKYCEVGTHHN